MAELAPGCFVLGLGSSTEVVVQQWFDVPFSRPLPRTREAALAVRALLSGQRVRAMKLRRAPRARLPIYIAALGPKMLRLAGEVGDGVVFFLCGPRIIPELLAEVGSDVDSVALVVLPGLSAEVRLAARRIIATYALVPFYARSLARQGFEDEVAAVGAACIQAIAKRRLDRSRTRWWPSWC